MCKLQPNRCSIRNKICKRGRSSTRKKKNRRRSLSLDDSGKCFSTNGFFFNERQQTGRERVGEERVGKEEAFPFRVRRFVSLFRRNSIPERLYSLSENSTARWQKISGRDRDREREWRRERRERGSSPLRKLRYSLLRRSASRCKSFNKYSSSNISLFCLSSSAAPASTTTPLILLGLVNSCMRCSHRVSPP